MAYSDEAVNSKLNGLNETHESIVSVAQWIMFHRRRADHTAALWHSRLQDSPTPAKRLTLIYLANEVVQQSRARSKTEFLVAFEPVIGDATALAYKTASSDVRDKLRRVVEVWRQRKVFDLGIQEGVEQRLREVDQQRAGKAGGGRLGGSLFGGGAGGSVPAELEQVAKLQASVSKNEASARPALEKAKAEHEKMNDPEAKVPTPPVHAHKLRELVKVLAVARGAVEESIKVRTELISGLEKLVESNRAKLVEEEAARNELSTQFADSEAKKDAVEDAIVRGVANAKASNGAGDQNGGDLEAPEVEGFTPPPPDVESFTLPALDNGTLSFDLGENGPAEQSLTGTIDINALQEAEHNLSEQPPAFEPTPSVPSHDAAAAAANSFLENLGASGLLRNITSEDASGVVQDMSDDPRLKRRKMSHHGGDLADVDVFGAASGVDEDAVSAMLNANGDNTDAGVGGDGW